MGAQLQMLCSVRSSPELRCGHVCPAVRACVPACLCACLLDDLQSPVSQTDKADSQAHPKDPIRSAPSCCAPCTTQLRLTGGAEEGAAVNGTVIKRKPGETAHCIRVHCLQRGQ